jgi:hypothetical protein
LKLAKSRKQSQLWVEDCLPRRCATSQVASKPTWKCLCAESGFRYGLIQTSPSVGGEKVFTREETALWVSFDVVYLELIRVVNLERNLPVVEKRRPNV